MQREERVKTERSRVSLVASGDRAFVLSERGVDEHRHSFIKVDQDFVHNRIDRPHLPIFIIHLACSTTRDDHDIFFFLFLSFVSFIFRVNSSLSSDSFVTIFDSFAFLFEDFILFSMGLN